MNDPHEYVEENLARLIQAGFGSESRLDPTARAQMLRRLTNDLRARQRVVALPQWIVVALTGFLVLLAAWLVFQHQLAAIPLELNLAYPVAAFILILNLIFIPVSSIFIVLRRRYV
jgi:hypothetical protein